MNQANPNTNQNPQTPQPVQQQAAPQGAPQPAPAGQQAPVYPQQQMPPQPMPAAPRPRPSAQNVANPHSTQQQQQRSPQAPASLNRLQSLRQKHADVTPNQTPAPHAPQAPNNLRSQRHNKHFKQVSRHAPQPGQISRDIGSDLNKEGKKKGFGLGFARKKKKDQEPDQVNQIKHKEQNPYDQQGPRRLSRESLKKEVIETQIEIEKGLIENQKYYAQGINTIKDLISPSAVKISNSRLDIGTKFVRSHFILTYPRLISTGWLDAVINADIPLDLSIFIYPRDSEKVLRELKKKVGKIQASLQINAEQGQARDPELDTAYQDVEQLRDAIAQGVEKFYRVGIYVTVYGNSEEEMERYSKTIESFLSRQNIIAKRAALQMEDGFNSTLPILKDDLNVFSNLNTSPLSASFPFVSSDLSSDNGILYGINRHNTSLVIFDRFELENANSVIFATSGAGKSYAVKLELLRSLMMGTSVLVIDPENEYKLLADTIGGTYVNMSLNSDNRINPFDLPKPLPGENNADILRSAIIDILGLISLMVGTLTPEESATMERAIMETYAKRDITDSTPLEGKIMPTMSELVNVLTGIVGGESLAQRLYRYTEGAFAGIFNQRTNININNNFVVFNIRDLQEQLRPIAMYILLKYIWNEIRSEKKRRILAVDEAWLMMQHEDSAKFLYGLVKRARKYYLGVTTITQDVGDFLQSEYGKPIVTNSAMKLLLKQSTAAIDRIKEIFNLTDGESMVLLQSSVGQGIFFAGDRHVAIEIIAFPTEHKIITTNPKDQEKETG